MINGDCVGSESILYKYYLKKGILKRDNPADYRLLFGFAINVTDE